MKLFRRSDQAQAGRQPANLRPRDPQRRTPDTMSQGRTFSYYAARSQAEANIGRQANQPKQPLRQLPGRLHRLRRHAGWLAAGLVGVAVLVYQLQLSTTPHVVLLADASDTPFLKESSVYQAAAHRLFEASAGNRNKLTVNATNVAAQLQRQFPELQDVSVTLPLIGDKPTVYVRPAAPSVLLTAVNGSYVIDANGRALAQATAGADLDRLKIPTVTDQSSLGAKLGQQVLPRSAVSFIVTVNDQLQQQGYTIQSMTLPAAAGQLNVYVANKPYFVKFNMQATGQDAAQLQAGTFIATAKKLEKAAAQPAEYIDVRLEGRAYYK